MRRIFFISIILMAVQSSLVAQDMLVPTKVSQYASVTQRIGTTDITIVYHSPLAIGRKIFGGVVPYDLTVDGVQYPWRAGANQNTTIEFSQEVEINGTPLAKGKYGLHVYVEEEQWTFIFSKNSEKWGSFSYDQNEDALRMTVPVQRAGYQDWLSYSFINRKPESASVVLQWTDVKGTFDISVDVTKNAFVSIKEKEEKSATDYAHMAQLLCQLDSNRIDEAISYIDQSISLDTTFQNQMIKARLLVARGDLEKGKKLEKIALANAAGFDWYYYALSFLLLEGDEEAAYDILSEQLSKEPESYPVNLALGEYYLKLGDQMKATFHFEKAYKYAGERSKNYTRYMYWSNRLILERGDG